MIWGLLVAPVLGALIGYGTNWLAIKMLFRPRKPVFVFGRRVPLTPGLFVARREQFADQLAELTRERFLTGRDLCLALAQAHDSGFLGTALGTFGSFAASMITGKLESMSPEKMRMMMDSLSDSIKETDFVDNIIRDKVSSMEVEEVESMVLGVIQRELRAITALGGFLGFAIGGVQSIVLLFLM
jgi:uncharacterized membrane protein YheB (UPF0754 family)